MLSQLSLRKLIKTHNNNPLRLSGNMHKNIPIAHATLVDNFDSGVNDVGAGSAPPMEELQQFQNEGGAREFLSTHGFCSGLQDTFVEALTHSPLRFFILDDSGSMAQNDGKRIVTSNGKKSRWSELTDALKFHINFSRQACAPTEFRFLNSAAPIKIGYNDAQEPRRLETLLRVLDSSPTYQTPLCRHIREVISEIKAVESQLRAKGQKACVIIATDGESSDGNIVEAMAPLKDLPVWVVVRLCTDDERIGNYWNKVDDQLEVSIDVLDDLNGEAAEVYEHNPWLTYGEPLQRLREFGISIKEIDMLDEKKLSPDEMRRVVQVILGGKLDDYPHPELDMAGFVNFLDVKLAEAGQTWDPMSKKDKPWIDKRKLVAAYGSKGCTIS